MYLEVAVASPIANTLTYKTGADIPASSCKPGLRVLVPLGPRLVTGYVLRCFPGLDEEPQYTIRAINDILDQEPLFPETMVAFYEWLARYYHYPIGEVIKCALPGGLSPQSGRQVDLTEAGHRHFASVPAATYPTEPWFAKLLTEEKLSRAATQKIWRGKGRRLLEKLQEKGHVKITQVVSTDTTKPLTETCFALSSPETATDLLSKQEEKTLGILDELTRTDHHPWVAKRDIVQAYSGARKALSTLTEKQMVEKAERPVYRNPFGERPPAYPPPDKLTEEQDNALQQITSALQNRHFCPFLIHGVTGSGKTEVYIRAAEQTIALGKTVIVLVPEIALATQLEGNFLSRFEDRIALLHSGLSAGERFDQWQRIVHKKAQVVIGARSAIFAPLEDIGLIIVDEEHDSAYKQEDSFRYQARDAAVLRASQNKAVVVLGSATPSVVSYQHALTGKYTLLNMPNRVGKRSLPEVDIIDLKAIPTTTGRPPLFSPQLIKALKENFSGGDQSILFLNRRGYAQLMLCQSCGKTLQCGHCNISLTLHQSKGELRCHYCGFSRKSITRCPSCQSDTLTAVGFGTERVETELLKILPQARIARLDRDTTLKRSDFIKILKQVHRREVDILIGTQMVAKGHHFPGVTLVGVIWADAGLGIPDYKSSERTFQVLTQVFGRAGRGDKPGRVLVQTHHPGHYSIQTAQSHDYITLFDQEISLRRTLSYPPFSRLLNVQFKGKNKTAVGKCARSIANFVRNLLPGRSMEVLGPSPAPLSVLRDLHRWQLLIKSSDLALLSSISTSITAHKSTLAGMSSVKLTIDVDPESML